MIFYSGLGPSRSYYYLCISHIKPEIGLDLYWTSQRIYYIARKAHDLKPAVLLMDVQFFTCVYEFHSVKGRKAGVRGVGWGQSCCVSLQRVNYCHDALLIFVYIFLMHCTEVAFAWLSNNYMGCEQTALPNERYMGIGGGNLFSFFFISQLLDKIELVSKPPQVTMPQFPCLLDGYNNTDVFRNILGDSWGREECQLRNGHQHLYCCYYLYYLT